MKLAMISQPMGNLTDDEILDARNRAITFLEDKGYEVVDSFFGDEDYTTWVEDMPNPIQVDGILYLAKSLELMSQVECVYFLHGWEQARGCVIEHEVAKKYDIPTLVYES